MVSDCELDLKSSLSGSISQCWPFYRQASWGRVRSKQRFHFRELRHHLGQHAKIMKAWKCANASYRLLEGTRGKEEPTTYADLHQKMLADELFMNRHMSLSKVSPSK